MRCRSRRSDWSWPWTGTTRAALMAASMMVRNSGSGWARSTGLEAVADHDALVRALRLLPGRRVILVLRFVDELSQSQMEDKMGTSQMHVSRLLAQPEHAATPDDGRDIGGRLAGRTTGPP